MDARITHEERDREFPAASPIAESPVPRFGQATDAIFFGKTPWRTSPSSIEEEASAALPPLEIIALGTGLGIRADHCVSATDRGTAWHLAFRTLCQRPDLRD